MATYGSSQAPQNPVDYSKYLPLYRAILAANWDEAQIFFYQHPTAIKSPLKTDLETALHVGARVGNASFMENLVALLSAHELSPRDAFGSTPLHIAARHGNIEVAHILLAKNSNLHYIPNNSGWFPIHYAATNHRKSKDAFLYFYRDGQHGQPNPYEGPTGVSLLAELIEYKFYDLALQVIGRYPDLGRHKRLANDASALVVILNDCSIVNLNFWQRFIYYCVSKDESETCTPIFHIITSLLPWLVGKSIVNKMVLHHQAVKLLKCLCDQLTTLNDTKVVSLAKDAVIEAASLDIWQVILNIVEAYPMSVYFKNSNDQQNILHIAVEKRSENVFNLVCGTNVVRSTLLDFPDINRNSVLHLAGKLAPPHKLNLVSGAALQMQRELQWFKEVKKISPSRFLSYRNRDGKTPSMVFTEEHKELKEAGEKWMKDTATSCTIAAALIVTVVFAAAITVPGGNGGNGLPFFSNKNAFTVFAISNAASLFTSATSLLVFLSILTSRYAEQDFLFALPKRLIIGLFTLFLSIIFMMIAFSATVYLVFGQNRRGVLIIVAAFACLPVTSFVLLQFPLLVALVSSTYGRGIFDQSGFPQLIV